MGVSRALVHGIPSRQRALLCRTPNSGPAEHAFSTALPRDVEHPRVHAMYRVELPGPYKHHLLAPRQRKLEYSTAHLMQDLVYNGRD